MQLDEKKNEKNEFFCGEITSTWGNLFGNLFGS